MSNKNYTSQICENTIYLAEKRGIKHLSSIESSLNLSRGYLSRCLNHENKKLSADVVALISEFFDVSLNDLYYVDLRGYDDMLNNTELILENEEDSNEQ